MKKSKAKPIRRQEKGSSKKTSAWKNFWKKYFSF